MQLVVMLSAQRDHEEVMGFCCCPPIPCPTIWCGSSAGRRQHSQGCVLTQRVYVSFTQRRRFGLSMKDSGDSGSTESVRIFFAFSCTRLAADTEGTMSLSPITERIFSSGRRSPLCATLSGITSARSFLTSHQHNSGNVRICDSGKPESRRITSRIQDTRFPAAIPASCSVCCPDKV